MTEMVLSQLRLTRWDAKADRRVFTAPAMLFFSLSGAAATGLMAQVRVPLPCTPVPFTGQVLAVLLCGAFLGGRYGLLSQLLYAALGATCIPWFSGGNGGMTVLLGATGGYVIGFAAAAFLIGTVTHRSDMARTLEGQIKLLLLGVMVIYFCATAHLMLALGWSFSQAMWAGVLPFLAADLFKAVLAAMLTSAVLPRKV